MDEAASQAAFLGNFCPSAQDCGQWWRFASNGGGLRAKPADIVGHLPSPEHLHPYKIPNPVEASMYPHSPRWDWENQRNVVHV